MIIIREQLSNILINTHKLNRRSMNCFIYLLIHRCWSNLGSRCSLWQRYPLPETGSPKWWWVCPYRWQKQPKVWRKYAGCCPNETPGVKRHGVAVISLTSPPFSRSPLSGFGGAFLQQRSSFASRKREPPAPERLRWEAQIRHISNARCLKRSKTVGHSVPGPWKNLCRLLNPLNSSSSRRSIGYSCG